jgi:subtilisin-like proprotein convertase family protein
MDARNAAQWIGAILVILTGICGGAVYAETLHVYTGDFNLPIPAELNNSKGWMADAVINIPDHITVSDLDVGITLTHTSAFDLQIFLQSPFEKKICLNMYDPFYEFFIGENYTNTIFDDEALFSIKEADAPFTGRFRPVEPYQLSKFDGENAYGYWHLQIYDAWEWDTGAFNRFELMITTAAPEPATAILLAIGLCLMRFHRCQDN